MTFEYDPTQVSATSHDQPKMAPGPQPAHHPPSVENHNQALVIEQMADRIKKLELFLSEERLNTQKQLKLAESRLSAFMTHTPAFVWINDRDGNLLFNNKILSLQNPEQQNGKNVTKLLPSEIASQYQANNRIVIDTNQPLQVVEPILLEDGTFGQAMVYKFPLPDLTGVITVGGVGIDITDQFRIQEQLRLSEERYRLVVDNLKEVVFQTDATGNFVFLNPAWIEITGFETSETIGHFFLDFVHPEDRELNLDLFNALVERKKDYCRHEIRYLTRGGGFRWIEVFARLTISLKEEVLGISGTLNDITVRKEAEKDLKQRASEFEALVENAPDIISRIDRKLQHRYVNKAVVPVTGIPVAEFLGKTHGELGMPPAQVTLWQKVLEEVFSTGCETTLEYEFPTTQGVRYFHSRLVPEIGENGRIETVLNIARDITVRKQAEELLIIRAEQQKIVADLGKLALEGLELEGFLMEVTNRVALCLNTPYTQIVESLPDGQEFRLRAGTGWETRQLGVFKREKGPNSISNYTLVTGKPVIADYLNEDQSFTLPIPLQNKGVTGGVCIPINIKQKQKKPFGVLSAYTLNRRVFTQDDVNFLESIANLIAITIEQKKILEESLNLERQFLQSQKMESLGVLAGGIAHDFNNLLGAILGNTELAQLMLEESSLALPYLEKTVTAIQRAAELVQQLLSYAGKAKSQVIQTNLNDLITEMADLLYLPLTNKINLEFNLQPGLSEVRVDPTQMRQIVMNLISNSTEAIGSSEGTITFTTGLIRADRNFLDATYLGDEREEGSYIFLQLTDSGSGMDQITQRKIFEPFFTTKFTGRGLGLSAVMGIVQSHQGALKVESEPGKGTTFTILLPVPTENFRSEVSQTEQETALLSKKKTVNLKGNSKNFSKGTILIIEDDLVLRETTGRLLTQLNFKPLLAHDGKSGLQLYKENKGEIDCVLLDMVMPQMGGEEVLPRLLELNPKVKVIIMSGYSEEGVATLQNERGKEGFRWEFVQKPFNIETMETLLNKILGK